MLRGVAVRCTSRLFSLALEGHYRLRSPLLNQQSKESWRLAFYAPLSAPSRRLCCRRERCARRMRYRAPATAPQLASGAFSSFPFWEDSARRPSPAVGLGKAKDTGCGERGAGDRDRAVVLFLSDREQKLRFHRSEEHTSELQSLRHLVCRL